jgi:Tfp pilus assembly protein FimT
MLVATLAVVLAFAAPALGQVSGNNGNGNMIVCVNEAAQFAQAAANAQADAEATLLNLIDQLNLCGVFVSDDDTTINDEDTTINDEDTTINDEDTTINDEDTTINDEDTTINDEDTTINDEDITQEADQEAESGNLDTAADVGNWGDNTALCAPIMQSGNTGNGQGEQQLGQSGATADDIEPGSNTSELNPELSEECAPAVNQSMAS